MSEELPIRPIPVSEETIRTFWGQEMRTILKAMRQVQQRLDAIKSSGYSWAEIGESLADAAPGNTEILKILAAWDSSYPEVSSGIIRSAIDMLIPGTSATAYIAELEKCVRAVLDPHRQMPSEEEWSI